MKPCEVIGPLGASHSRRLHLFTDISTEQLPGQHRHRCLFHRCLWLSSNGSISSSSLVPRNPICKSPPFLEILNPLLPTWSLQWFYASLALKITNFRQPPCWIFSTVGCEILRSLLKMHSVMPACPWTWCCSLLSPRNGGGGDRDDDHGGSGSDDDDGGVC